MTSGIKGKRGFQRDYNPFKILSVLLKTREKKTSVVKKDLCKVEELYCKPTLKWYNESLQELEKNGFVKRIEKEMEKSYYWVITEEGILKLEECEKKEE